MKVDELSTVNVDEAKFEYTEQSISEMGWSGNYEARAIEMLTLAGFKGVVKTYLVTPEDSDLEGIDEDDEDWAEKLLAKLECNQFTAVIEDETEYFVRDHKVFGTATCSRGYWEMDINGHTYVCSNFDGTENWSSWEEK